METNENRAITLTEIIGTEAAALGKWIERIYYNPEGIADGAMEDLEKILQAVQYANRLAREAYANKHINRTEE